MNISLCRTGVFRGLEKMPGLMRVRCQKNDNLPVKRQVWVAFAGAIRMHTLLGGEWEACLGDRGGNF